MRYWVRINSADAFICCNPPARVFYLVALRHTLTTLMLRGNKSVTDNAISALLLLSRLRTLGLRGTSITMAGLHRLMPFSDNLYLHVPAGCEAYLDSESCLFFFRPVS